MSVLDGASDDDDFVLRAGALGLYDDVACDGADGGVAGGGEAVVRAEVVPVGDWAAMLLEWVCLCLGFSW